jgi:hypothetical protein
VPGRTDTDTNTPNILNRTPVDYRLEYIDQKMPKFALIQATTFPCQIPAC